MLYAALAVLGLSCGVLYDFVVLLERIISLKAASFILDFFYMVACALAFFCVFYAFSDGVMRAYYYAVPTAALAAYRLIVSRPLENISLHISGSVNKFIKKLLHYNN